MNINSAHWHLLLNHFPIILSMTGTGFLIAALIFKKQHLQFASMLLLIVAGVFGYLAYSTGEGAEHQINDLPGVSKTMIDTHQHIASTGLDIILATGAFALITILLLHFKKTASLLFMWITLAGALGSAGVMGYVGYTGGEIRHSEIRGDFGGAKTQPVNSEGETKENE